MQVDLVVIVLSIYARLEILVRVALHHAGGNGFFDLVVQFLYRPDAQFLAVVLGAPDGQRRAPVARAAQVPVVEVLQPFAETSRACRFGLPVDCLVEGDHPVLAGGGLDEPAIERVVDYRLVRAPAVRVVVGVLLYLECLVGSFQLHAYRDVERLVLVGERGIIIILDETSLVLPVQIDVD